MAHTEAAAVVAKEAAVKVGVLVGAKVEGGTEAALEVVTVVAEMEGGMVEGMVAMAQTVAMVEMEVMVFWEVVVTALPAQKCFQTPCQTHRSHIHQKTRRYWRV